MTFTAKQIEQQIDAEVEEAIRSYCCDIMSNLAPAARVSGHAELSGDARLCKKDPANL